MWGKSPAEYPDVRGFRMGFRADRCTDAPDEGMAGRHSREPGWRSSSSGQGGRFRRCEWTCEEVARKYDGTLIRINTREAEVPAGHISLPLGALAGLWSD